jgi:hypothetical protein
MKLHANHKETLVQLAQRAIKNRDVNTFSVEVFFGDGSYVLKQEDTLTEVLKALKLLELKARLLSLTK